MGPELESDPERGQLLAGRSARTGSGQSVDGTSGRRQEAPFAGSPLRSRLFVPSTRTSSSNLASREAALFARRLIRGEQSPRRAAGARKRGAGRMGHRARRFVCFRTRAVTHPTTRSAARSRPVTLPRSGLAPRARDGRGNGTGAASATGCYCPAKAGPARASSAARHREVAPGPANSSRSGPGARTRRGCRRM